MVGLSATVSAAVAISCGGAEKIMGPPPVASVSVAIQSTSLVVGNTTQATATLKAADGTVIDGRSVSWSSSHPEIATVSAAGEVTALRTGNAEIKATSEGKDGSAAVTVTPPPVASVTVTLAASALSAGSNTTATASLQDASGNALTGRPIVWTTDNAEVATVSPEGVVTAVKAGTATITATSEGKSGTATVTVLVAVSEVGVTLPQPGLSVGFSIQASAVVKDISGNPLTGRTVTWSSSNIAVATVNQAGVVMGVSAGVADIIATSNGKTGAATIGIIVITPRSLSAGYAFTCAISTEGDAYCWGENVDGQLGDGTTTRRLSPVKVAGGLKFSAIASKQYATYALTSDGRLFCWGACPSWATSEPRQVETRRALYHLGDGIQGACAVGVGNIAYCWGDNSHGELGTGSIGGSTAAPDAPVAGNHDFVEIGSGENHACARTTFGKPYCWGYEVLGDGNQVGRSSVPQAVPGTYSFKAIVSGNTHSCGLTNPGAAYCWGFIHSVGVPYESCSTRDGGCHVPVAVEGGHVFESIASGQHMSCGVTAAGDPYCWGLQPYGDTPISFRHWSVEGETYAAVKYRTVSPGAQHVCAISTEGDAYCMNHYGYGNPPDGGARDKDVGLLGDGTTDISRAVRKVIGGIKFKIP